MHIELLKDIGSKHIGSFCDVLVEFQDEVFKSDRKIDVESLLLYNDVYIVIEDDKVIAFVSFAINDYFGFREPTVFCNFLHILKNKRRSKAVLFISMQIGAVVEHRNLPLEFCFATSGSFNLGQRLNGKKAYDTYIYESSEVMRDYEKHKKYFKKKRS